MVAQICESTKTINLHPFNVDTLNGMWIIFEYSW